MKKEVIVFIWLFFIMLFIPLALAENITLSSDDNDETAKINKAKECLKDKIDAEGCDDLTSEERIFALLAAGKCRTEVNNDAKNSECWPKSDCSIKTTAQAILAKGGDAKAEKWLLSYNTTSSQLEWFIEIESPEDTTCEITYGSSSYSVPITDKKINTGAGSCLSLSEGQWWLRVSPSCFDEEFEISCDKRFLTTLLFKKQGSSTIHVSSEIHSASEDGTTTEKINSVCFGKDSSCDYEDNLWAALVLDYAGEDVSAYKPYLVTMAEDSDNDQYLPEAFLYYLLGSQDYLQGLLSVQNQYGYYWDVSGNKFYDTAIALLPFQGENVQHKTDAKEWLLGAQDSQGCWQGNIRDTAFLLFSVFGQKSIGDDNDPALECDDVGFCMPSSDCTIASGSEMSSYSFSCTGMDICCDKQKQLDTCAEMNGQVCGQGKDCSISDVESSDEQHCCTGVCEDIITPTISECVSNGGTCRNSCSSSEKDVSYSCDYSSEYCCVTKSSGGSKLWLWILIGLIVLVLIAIFFKDAIRRFLFRLKSGSREQPGNRPSGPGGFLPPPSTFFPPRQPFRPRGILMPQRQAPSRGPPPRRMPPKPKGELDEVLKKLKDMSK